MSDESVIRVIKRRRLFLALGLIGTVLAMGWVYRIPGVYYAQVDDVFLAPQSTRFPNSLTSGGGSLIVLAGIIEREFNGEAKPRATSAAGITIVDQGIRRGVQVRLPDTGGQWAHNFSEPLLDVQVVGPTAEYVRTNLAAIQTKIHGELARMQAQAHVDQYNLITIESSPAEPDIQYLTGHRKIAVLVTGVLGVALSMALVVFVDRRMRRAPDDVTDLDREPVAVDA